MEHRLSTDYLFVGGGLHCGLAALALRKLQPEASIVLVEQSASLGGDKLWSFHQGDAPSPMPEWLSGLVAHRWSAHELRFPKTSRRIPRGYYTVESANLERSLLESFVADHCKILLNARVTKIDQTSARLEGGGEIRAKVVFDGRGMPPDQLAQAGGFQKFVGMELETESPHGLVEPILMDATVEQIDGFRFLYVLPFGERRLFLEDTYFSDTASLDVPLVKSRIVAYARHHGFDFSSVAREESGVLAMPIRELSIDDAPLTALGVRGGWHHPATAYSMPCAIRVASAIAGAGSPTLALQALEQLRRKHRKQTGFARLLNRMLFRCYPPDKRVHVFEKFYGLEQATIERFYSLQLLHRDRLRILSGRPPQGFSIGRALGRAEGRA